MTGPLVGVSRAVVGAAHVTACVVLLVAFFVTGAGLLLALASVAAWFAWWLLREDGPPAPPRAGCGCVGGCDGGAV